MLFGKHLNKYYLKYLPAFLLGIVALLVVDYVQLLMPEIYRMVINGLIDGSVEIDGVVHDFDMAFLLDRICLPMIIVIITLVVGRFLWRLCFRGAAVKMETRMRGEMFDKCASLDEEYYERNKVGALMTLFTNDLETVQDCFGWGVLMLCDALFLFAIAIVKMYRMDPVLTLLSTIPLAFLLAIGAVLDHHMEKRWDKRQAAFSSLSDFSQETFSGIAVVKAFVKETVRLMSFKKINRENEDTNVAHTSLSTLLHVLVTLFVESVVCVILGYGGYLVYKGDFDAGRLVEFIGYFTAIVWPIMAVSQLIEMRSRGNASLKRIGALLDEEPLVADGDDAVSGAPRDGSISFKNLTFRYTGAAKDAIRNASFEIKSGEHVGIVGRTGSGKSTVASLLLRIYNVDDGTLFVGGEDVNKIPIRSVREHIAYVPQDNFLFSDTIRNNIAFSTDGSDGDAVERAATVADVHTDIIGFAKGYDTVLGERGVTVSGGQKQRISIARALIKDAPILLLDDAVSAVDVKTERSILNSLKEIRRDRTTILIAHRISTVEGMDKIIYLEDGAVVDVGTHSELVERCEGYRRSVELQRIEDEEVKGNV